eukprot:CAMPEP_0175258666 /NCGR_PEP_ID=MMETSP0093-20121207/39346_1 /TAXON_ID=311494 /ORGANISM="Alexandrium monilatum, Strain CCMP3105" /LENGTH=655 /DNA_ID=CAMNT_0016553069 /DNA_START=1 /DNA_END=1968 /DNA_ORIENTATION=-
MAPVNGRSEEDLQTVFSRLKHDNELHRDDLPRALELLRFLQPDPRWIEQAYEQFSQYSTLSQDEFITFIRDYEIRRREAAAVEFKRLDGEKTGSVEVSALMGLFRKFGLEVMPRVLRDAVAEAGRNSNGGLEFDEFESVFELIQVREGFTYDLFMDVFSKFDSQGRSGFISTAHFISILHWLGFSWTEESADDILRKVDLEHSGKLSEREFLCCLRKVREQELEKIKHALQREGALDYQGRVPVGKLEPVFALLGYVPDAEPIDEAVKDAGVTGRESLDLADLWEIFTVYRSREGFCAAEEREIFEAFRQCDAAGVGTIAASDVGKVLRSLGCPTAFEVRQHLLSKIDLAGKGQLDFVDVRKLVRMCLDREKIAMRRAFEAKDPEQTGEISKEAVFEVLNRLKIADAAEDFPAREILLELVDGDVVDLADFLFVANSLHKAARRACRENGGFSTTELRELKLSFQGGDRAGVGEVLVGELLRIVDRLFPSLSRDAGRRPALERMVSEIGGDGVEFDAFLRFIVQCRETTDQFRFEKEEAAIKQTCFSPEEVRQFRELFLAGDDGDHELSLSEALEMVRTVLPICTKSAEEFRAIFLSITPWSHGVDGRSDQADFPEFLVLMRQMMDMNFAGINDHSEKIATDPLSVTATLGWSLR